MTYSLPARTPCLSGRKGKHTGPGASMDFMYDEHELATYEEENELLDQLFKLETDVLYGVISHLHSYLFGSEPTHMKSWNNDQMVSWFEQTYQYDIATNSWKARITKH